MPDNHSKINTSDLVYIFGFSLSYLGLFFSPFIASLGTALFLVSIVLNRTGIRKLTKELLLFSIPLVFILFDYLRTENYAVVSNKLLLSVGFLVIGVATLLASKSLKNYSRPLFVFALSILLIINILSVSNYFMHKEELDVLLLQSKSIPIIGGMHHIHFGIINALSIVFLLYYLVFGKPYSKRLLVVISVVLVFCFHVLSSRTGLVSLYAALALVVFIYALKEKAYKQSIITFIVLILVNVLAYNLSSSFRNKLANSVEDIESWSGEESINYKSMGMRLEAYKVSIHIMKKYPWFGVGSGNSHGKMQDAYLELNTSLYPENRIGPHNQFLEYGMKYGIWGLLFVLVFFIYWMLKSLFPLNYGLLCVVLVLFFSSQFESLFERQVSVFILAFTLPAATILFEKKIRAI